MLAPAASDWLSRNGVLASVVNARLRQSPPLSPAQQQVVHLEQAQAVHAFLVQQQRLRRITSAALVLECTPEAFRLDPQQHLRPLLACLEEFGLSQEQTTAVFRALRRRRDQAAHFLQLGPAELRRRWFFLSQNLGLEGHPAAAYLASAPTLLLADPADAAAAMRWLYAAAGWRRQALRRNLQRSPDILLTPVAQLEAAAALLQRSLDASIEELVALLSVAPRLLALPQAQLADAVAAHPCSWRLAAEHMERPPLLMRHGVEAMHLQIATLYIMHLHGWSRAQVAELAREHPTWLRALKLQ